MFGISYSIVDLKIDSGMIPWGIDWFLSFHVLNWWKMMEKIVLTTNMEVKASIEAQSSD